MKEANKHENRILKFAQEQNGVRNLWKYDQLADQLKFKITD